MTQALQFVERLKKIYPDAECTLDYDQPWKLLFNARLAAQCTDKKVNEVAIELYKQYPDLNAFAEAEIENLEKIIKPTGFYHVKSRDLKACAVMLIEQYNGTVPDNIDDLIKLPGIGRKVANLIVGDIYKKDGAVVTDTHCIRLANRFGLVHTKNPQKVEFALRDMVPAKETNNFCHRLVMHGRAVCSAQHPKCENCPLNDLCAKII